MTDRIPQRLAMAVLAALLAFAIRPCAADTAPKIADLPQGDYVTEGGWGTMLVSTGTAERKNGTLKFKIESQGANAHTCELEGIINQNLTASLSDDSDATCTVLFKPSADGVEVDEGPAPSSCAGYCGMRAGFTGKYFKVSRICEPHAAGLAVATFDSTPQADEAEIIKDKVMPVLAQCRKTLRDDDASRLRQAIALSRYHAGDKAGCRDALKPDAELIAAGFEYANTPADSDNYGSLAKKLKDTLDLCRQ